MPLFGLGRARRSVGLDVGSGVLKLVVIDHGRDEPQLETVAMRPLSGSAIVDGEVVDPTLVSDAIRDLFAGAAVEPEHLVISVGGRDVIIKLIRMDRMDEVDARAVIRWEAEQHVPFDMENVELDFQITDPGGTGPRMKVLLVAAKRELVDNELTLIEEAGLEPAVVDVDAFALFNAVELNYPEAMDGTAALVSVGHDGTSVTLLEDGVPVLTRDLAFGIRRLTRELQRQEGLTAEEAGRVLRGDAERAGLDRFVADRATEIARGIERAATFLETRRVGERLGRLYLCGGGVNVPGLPDALADRLGIETHVASPIRRLQVKPGALADPEVERAAPLLVLATGLALRRPS